MKPDPAAILRLLLCLVPECYALVKRGHLFIGIYDTILSVIEEYGSDEQSEWSDLAKICRQDRALLEAGG